MLRQTPSDGPADDSSADDDYVGKARCGVHCLLLYPTYRTAIVTTGLACPPISITTGTSLPGVMPEGTIALI